MGILEQTAETRKKKGNIAFVHIDLKKKNEKGKVGSEYYISFLLQGRQHLAAFARSADRSSPPLVVVPIH